MTLDRDAATTEALLTDLYLDALLAGVVLDAATTGATPAAAVGLDPAARRAAERLRHDLVRVHPSFRFEERLATRLAEAAAAMHVKVAGGGGRVVTFRADLPIPVEPGLVRAGLRPDPRGDLLATDPPTSAGATSAGALDPGRRLAGRPLLIGGALTSAALSIAGAAFVAWRLARPGRDASPMARAARAVRAGTPERQPLRGPRRSSATPSARGLD